MKTRLIIFGWLLSLIAAVVLTKLYWPSADIEIVTVKYTETVFKNNKVKTADINNPEDCQQLKEWANSDLHIDGELQEDILKVKAYDDIKSATADFKLRARDTRNHIVQLSYQYQYEIGQSVGLAYLYNFDFFMFGGGPVISRTNPGLQIIIQKAF